jgi:ribonuclease P protein component
MAEGVARIPRRALALSGAAEFKAVLVSRFKAVGEGYFVRALAKESGAPRLGLIAARKSARRAVDRNRAKRLARQVFRESVWACGVQVDVVLGMRNDLRGRNNEHVREELRRILGEVLRQVNGSAPTVVFKDKQ